jgi:hypothetical protein
MTGLVLTNAEGLVGFAEDVVGDCPIRGIFAKVNGTVANVLKDAYWSLDVKLGSVDTFDSQ